MAPSRPSGVHYRIYEAILLAAFLNLTSAAGQQQAPVASGAATNILIPNLPPSHYRFWLKNSPTALKNYEQICSDLTVQNITDLDLFRNLHRNFTFEDQRITTDLTYGKRILDTVCSKIDLARRSCWGYETNCDFIYLMPECDPSGSDSQADQERKIEWFSQADFGFILNRRRELSRYCAPDKRANHSIKSSLECTKYFRTCRGENLYLKIDHSKHLEDGPIALRKGQVGGWNCDLQLKRIEEEDGQRGFLRSWFNELRNYDINEAGRSCKERIENQAYLIQVDSSSNMYQYFSTFVNLYATMHLNNRFSEDNQLILWINQLPSSPFEDMWSVFSKNKPKSLDDFKGKEICLSRFAFAMPPRMTDGLFHQTPLVKGCSKSGLFDAFNKHVLHKLAIADHSETRKTDSDIMRVTIVSRSTPTRRILNEGQLRTALKGLAPHFEAQIVDLANITFREQLRIVHRTDILVGLHGSGLTHTLFLPDWAALVELYDCKYDRYRELARLRGVSYFTLRDGHNSGDKSMNFELDVGQVIETLSAAAQEVKQRRAGAVKVDRAQIERDEKIRAKGKRQEKTQPELQQHTEL